MKIYDRHPRVTKAAATTKLEGEYLYFTVKGDENIKIVEFDFNGKNYLMNTVIPDYSVRNGDIKFLSLKK